MRTIDETEKCWLDYDEDGCLTCTYNHKAGAECLLHDREEDEWLNRVCNVAEFLNLLVPEIKTDPRHLDPKDEDFIEIEKSVSFRMFMLGKSWKRFVETLKEEIRKILKKLK